MLQNRRDIVRNLTSAGFAAWAVTRAASAQTAPAGEIQVLSTSGAKRLAREAPIRWRTARASSAEAIVLDPSRKSQSILGFGASMTDAACYLLNRLAATARERLLHELFHPSEIGFSVCRVCLGSSDYATQAYSFDEGEPDPDMHRFSIDPDKAYILPMLRQARGVNPDLFLLGSPWSPPGWMKTGGSMLGGSMEKRHFASYAKYFIKTLQGYSAEGVPLNAVTVQNEVDTDQDGKMPACLWGQEYEIEFVSRHLGPQLAANHIDTRIWILDHNYNLWGRAIAELDDPKVNRYVDGVAWHGYVGEPGAMTRVHEAHPQKHMYWTEGGPAYNEPGYLTNWSQWASTIAGVLRNWSRCFIAWNIALDEAGKPNIGPFNCGGVVTIDSKSGEITRSGQYWALAHYSRAIRRGANRIGSSGELKGVSHFASVNPDGGTAAVLTNTETERDVVLRLNGSEVEVHLPADSVTTLSWGT
ncbi:MAG TPA: glycoside hydrolase family 30 beta sandwich domain-containing protein [Bryobacteraceae bacterium]|nr:glycoside hydrolase family 30 beta sandwich domain-containing protein [Bryobacteraceae bacterium]